MEGVDIRKKLEHIMKDNEKTNNIKNNKWIKYDNRTRILLNPKRKIEYILDKKIMDTMKDYTITRQLNPDIKIANRGYKNFRNIYIVYNKEKTIVSSTRSTILRAIKNMLYGYYNKEKKYNKLYKFKDTKVKIKLIGCVKGPYTESIKKYIYNTYKKIKTY